MADEKSKIVTDATGPDAGPVPVQPEVGGDTSVPKQEQPAPEAVSPDNPSISTLTCVGKCVLSFVLVIGATMVVGLNLLPISFCRMRTGRHPSCSLPTIGERSA